MATEPVLQLRAGDGGDGDDAVSGVSEGRGPLADEAGATGDGHAHETAAAQPQTGAAVLLAASGAPLARGPAAARAREGWAVKAARLDGMLADEGLCDVLCQRLMEGETVEQIACAWEVPAGRLRRWLMDDGTRYEAYRRALQIDAHRLVQEAVAIADRVPSSKTDVLHAKLRIETRFKTAAYHDRETYGDTAGKGGGTQVNVIVQRSQAVSQPTKEVSHAVEYHHSGSADAENHGRIECADAEPRELERGAGA